MSYSFIKRFFDIIFSIHALLILSPILILIILILFLTAEGEIFYLQERVGKFSKTFKIWKFATMVKNSPNIGSGDVTLRNDPRVLPFGRFLRISKINEIPQLINILKGDMSFTGPRPLMKAGFDRYENKIKTKIYNVKPGLTGIGSIVFRDEEKIMTNSQLDPQECYKLHILPYKGELELWYQNNMNFTTDFKILLATFISILFTKNQFYYNFFKGLPKRPNYLNI